MAGHHKWKDIKRKRAATDETPPVDADTPVENGLEKTADLTRRIIQVPKDEAVAPKRTTR